MKDLEIFQVYPHPSNGYLEIGIIAPLQPIKSETYLLAFDENYQILNSFDYRTNIQGFSLGKVTPVKINESGFSKQILFVLSSSKWISLIFK